MKHKEPVNLKPVLIVYNFAMVGLSIYMFHEVHCVFQYRCILFQGLMLKQSGHQICNLFSFHSSWSHLGWQTTVICVNLWTTDPVL